MKRMGKSHALIQYAIQAADSGESVVILSHRKSEMADQIETVMGHNVFPAGLHVVGLDEKQEPNEQHCCQRFIPMEK